MRKLKATDLELMKRGNYYSKLFRWSSDQEYFFDECEYLYDPGGRLIGVDYHKRRRFPNR